MVFGMGTRGTYLLVGPRTLYPIAVLSLVEIIEQSEDSGCGKRLYGDCKSMRCCAVELGPERKEDGVDCAALSRNAHAS